MPNFKNVICLNEFSKGNKCEWISFEVSLDYVKDWEKTWQIYWESIDEENRGHFGCKIRAPKIEDSYLNCQSCNGSYKNFRDATEEESKKIWGSTVGPILDRNEDFEVRVWCDRRKAE